MRSALQMLERKNNWRERLRSGLPENTFYGVSKERGVPQYRNALCRGIATKLRCQCERTGTYMVLRAYDSKAPFDPKCPQSIASRIENWTP